VPAPRLELRPLRPEDKDRLLAWRNSPEVAAYMFTDHRISPEEHERWFAGIAGDEQRAFWIIEVDGAAAGLANLYDIDLQSRSCATASYLADPALRGRGLGGLVERLLIGEAFGKLGLTKVWCEVLASNAAGLRMHEKLGYRESPLPRGRTLKNGEPVEIVRLELSASDWAGARIR
jgi:UDP-4-amino-4,6-dideoxy-N-acetyl-beta-L-altrosamine N-acetyltransferase